MRIFSWLQPGWENRQGEVKSKFLRGRVFWEFWVLQKVIKGKRQMRRLNCIRGMFFYVLFHKVFSHKNGVWACSVSLSVYYMAVCTIMLSRHGRNLARPVIIHDIIHSLMYQVLGSRRMETAPTSIEVLLHLTQSQSDELSDLRGSLSPTTHDVLVYTAPGSPRRSPIQLWTGNNVA